MTNSTGILNLYGITKKSLVYKVPSGPVFPLSMQSVYPLVSFLSILQFFHDPKASQILSLVAVYKSQGGQYLLYFPSLGNQLSQEINRLFWHNLSFNTDLIFFS